MAGAGECHREYRCARSWHSPPPPTNCESDISRPCCGGVPQVRFVSETGGTLRALPRPRRPGPGGTTKGMRPSGRRPIARVPRVARARRGDPMPVRRAFMSAKPGQCPGPAPHAAKSPCRAGGVMPKACLQHDEARRGRAAVPRRLIAPCRMGPGQRRAHRRPMRGQPIRALPKTRPRPDPAAVQPSAASQRAQVAGWACRPTSGRIFQQRWHFCPSAFSNTTVTPSTSGNL